MTTSGSVAFTSNRDKIIKKALVKVGAIDPTEEPDAETHADAVTSLNSILRHLQADGYHIWRTEEVIFFLTPGQRVYDIGSSGSDNASRTYVETALTIDATSGSIYVDDATDIAATNYIGVLLDDGTVFWSTVSSVVGTGIVLAGTPTTTASAGNRVIAYATKLVRPLAILTARRYDFNSQIETPLQIFDRLEYQEMPNKFNESTVNGVYYDRRGGANATGQLYAWPVPSDFTNAIKATVARPIELFETAGDSPDLPDEWTLALEWNLALELAVEYDVPEAKLRRIEKRAMATLADVKWWETELTSVSFLPEMHRR